MVMAVEWANRLLDYWIENPSIPIGLVLAFLLGACCEAIIEHLPDYWQQLSDKRRERKRRRQEGPQDFVKGSQRPDGPRPRPAAPQPGVASVVKGQKPPQGPTSGRHAAVRPRQRQARFFTRQRRSRD
jgi:hypothetical protein